MTRSLHEAAFRLACWDAAKQARKPEGLDQDFELEYEASILLDNQYDDYIRRAARLRRVQQ